MALNGANRIDKMTFLPSNINPNPLNPNTHISNIYIYIYIYTVYIYTYVNTYAHLSINMQTQISVEDRTQNLEAGAEAAMRRSTRRPEGDQRFELKIIIIVFVFVDLLQAVRQRRLRLTTAVGGLAEIYTAVVMDRRCDGSYGSKVRWWLWIEGAKGTDLWRRQRVLVMVRAAAASVVVAVVGCGGYWNGGGGGRWW